MLVLPNRIKSLKPKNSSQNSPSKTEESPCNQLQEVSNNNERKQCNADSTFINELIAQLKSKIANFEIPIKELQKK